MKILLFSLTLFVGQMMTMQDKPIVHLKPHTDLIEVTFAGSLLELSDAPETVYLPKLPPKPNGQGKQWSIDIKNFGPHPIKLASKTGFSTDLRVNQTVQVYSNGSAYFLRHP